MLLDGFVIHDGTQTTVVCCIMLHSQLHHPLQALSNVSFQDITLPTVRVRALQGCQVSENDMCDCALGLGFPPELYCQRGEGGACTISPPSRIYTRGGLVIIIIQNIECWVGKNMREKCQVWRVEWQWLNAWHLAALSPYLRGLFPS